MARVGFLILVLMATTVLSCQTPGGLVDLERVGHQHFGYLFRDMLNDKAKMDNLRAEQCPCVPESGIDVERYTADFEESYLGGDYEKARAIMIGLAGQLSDYDRSMTEARCHWTVSAEKFKPPQFPRECHERSFEPYEDGFGIMRDAQTAKPQTFVTGDGWFVYNLATNLAQM